MNPTVFARPALLLFAAAVAPLPRSSSVSSVSSANSANSASSRGEDILAHTKAVYAALHSYSDTGYVEVQYGASGSSAAERHTFRTYYRAPRLFFFDFVKAGNADQMVVWSDASAFHSWWQMTGVQSDYPKGTGSTAFTTGQYPTRGSLSQAMSLLSPSSGLVSTLTEFGDATDAGTEMVDGRPCHKLLGIAQSTYAKTGHVVDVRRTTLWIDVETRLVRKVFEDTPRGTPAGSVSRVLTTFRPHANPALGDDLFRFTPPETQ